MAQGDTGPGPRRDATTPIAIEDEMKRSYLDYAMSVIVSRAIPDARDGLKPVHRRILFGMHEQGHTYDRAYRKSAKIVGDVIGKYHPHGDSAVYDALVRLAQPFSMGLPLVDGQGNFGSVDGDPPAAMRYTECRSSYAASFILADIEKETVDFQDNYDGQEREPTVLPARFPNLLVNGAGGIAVGMATNIPPHNLGEVLDAAIAMVDRPDITDAELLDFVPAPDFPTGGLIIGRAGARSALLTGRGSVTMRARVEVEEGRGGRRTIIVKEIPYQVNKSTMIERIAELVREKRIEGVSEINDHSDRDGMRVVIDLKREAAVDVVLNQLYRHSALQISFGVNMLALNGGRPEMLTLRTSLQAFLAFREEVVARRTKFDLRKARERAHVLVALAAAVANIEEIIDTIRKAPDPATARERLMARAWPAGDMGPLIQLVADPRSVLLADGSIRLTDEQARAILALQLSRLTGLGRDEIGSEARSLSEKIQDFLDILSSRGRVAEIIKSELLEVRTAFATPRRSEIVDLDLEIEDEDLIAREDMVVTITRGGYVKRTNLDEYRTQRRGGRGRAGMAMKDEDVITRAFVASTHAPILCFSATGMAYKLKVWRLPQADPRGRGKAFVNLLPLAAEDTIANVMALPEDEAAWAELDVVFVTRSGHVRRNKLSDFAQINRSGKIAMKLDEGDGIVSVQLCSEADDVLLTTEGGRCIRFPVTDVRVFVGRTSTGVRGVALDGGDAVISAAILRHVDLTPAEARAYLRHAAAMRRAVDEDEAAAGEAALQAEDEVGEGDEADGDVVSLSPERLADLGAREEFVLTAANDGYGKRTSAYEYRCAGRGGKGLRAHDLSRGGRLAASFPVEEDDEVMIVTDAGQLIRAAVGEVRIASRATRGVRLIRVEDAERVVSVERIADQGAERAAP